MIICSLTPIEATTTPAPGDVRPTTDRRPDEADSVKQPASRVSVESKCEDVENGGTVAGDVSGVSIPSLLQNDAEASSRSPIATSPGASENNL